MCGISPTGADRHQICSHGFRAFSSHTVSSQGAWFCRAHFPISLTLWLPSHYSDKVDETLLSLLLCAQPRKSPTRCFLWLSYKHVAQAGLTACIDLRSKMGYFQLLISTRWGVPEWGDGISLEGVMHKPLKWKYKFLKPHMSLKLWVELFFSNIPHSLRVLLGCDIHKTWPQLSKALSKLTWPHSRPCFQQ